MFGKIYLETMQAWAVLLNSTVREEREWAIAELSTSHNAHDHVKHRLGHYFVRAQDGEYVVIHDDGNGEDEGGTYPITPDGLRMATFSATTAALKKLM